MDQQQRSGFSFGQVTVVSPFGSTAVDAKDAPSSSSLRRKESLSAGTTKGSTDKMLNKSAFAFLGAKQLKTIHVPISVNNSTDSSGPPPQFSLKSQWRDMEWTEERKTSLMKTISCYRPNCREVPQARVLLLGPVSSGKSSFISSVQSVFNGRVTNRAMVGSFLTSFTKKLQSFTIRGLKEEDHNGLVLCDIMGLGDEEMTRLTLHDILSVIKGHVPEGHKFSPDQPVTPSQTVGYVKKPSLKDKIHCVAFVVNASKILIKQKSLSSTFQQLREHISDLGVHQVALLTHIDEICSETAKDVSQVYKSRAIRDTMDKAGALLGMSTSYIVPVKNYSSELDLDVKTDLLLLRAVDHILQYADLYFEDNMPPQYTD